MYLNIAAALASFIGLACAFGGFVLRNGTPESWNDVTASDGTVKRTSHGLFAISALLLGTSAMAFLQIPWGSMALAVATLLFTAGGFWGNYALFGNLRPTHTGPNCLLAAVILSLLWLA